MKTTFIKRVICLFLVLSMILSFAGCGKNEDQNVEQKDAETADETAKEEPNEEEKDDNEGDNTESLPPILKELSDEKIISIDADAYITNQEYIALIVKTFELASADFEDVFELPVNEKYLNYYRAAVDTGVLSKEDGIPGEDVLKSDNAERWLRNAMHLDVGEDNIFSDLPEKMTVMQAYELVIKAFTWKKDAFSIREDAKNELQLHKNVKYTVSDDTVNILADMDTDNKTVTFTSPDEVLAGVSAGDILFIAPGEVFFGGFLAKIASVESDGSEVTLVCEEPALAEVIETVDISMKLNYSLPLDELAEDEDGVYYESLYNYFDTDATFTKDGLLWTIDNYDESTAGVRLESGNFSSKSGLYAGLDLRVELMVDMMMAGTNLDLDYFHASVSATSTVIGTCGLSSSLESELKISLAECMVPVAGPISVCLKPYLTVRVNGEINVEVVATLINHSYFSVSTVSGISHGNTSGSKISLDADAEGSLEAGVGINAGFRLFGTPFWGNVDIVYADAVFGFGARGETAVEQSLSYDGEDIVHGGHQYKADEMGRVHPCALCIDGETYFFDELEVGLGKELRETIKTYFDLDAKYTLPRYEFKWRDWYYSVGEDRPGECKTGLCPYELYEVCVMVTDEASGDPICDVKITAGDEWAYTNSKGEAFLYLDRGRCYVEAKSSACCPDIVGTGITVYDRGTSIGIEMNLSIDYYTFIKEELLPKLGLASDEEHSIEIEVTQDMYSSGTLYPERCWDERSGLISARIADVNQDGTADLVVYYFKSDDTVATAICVSVYTVTEDGSISEIGHVENIVDGVNGYSTYSNTFGIAEGEDVVYIVSGMEYQMHLTPGYGDSFHFYGFDENGTFGLQYSIRQSRGGTSGRGYSLYDYTQGENAVETIIYHSSPNNHDSSCITPADTPLEDALALGLGLIGLEASPEDMKDTESYIINKTRYAMQYRIDYSDGDRTYIFTSSFTDATNLKEKIEQ